MSYNVKGGGAGRGGERERKRGRGGRRGGEGGGVGEKERLWRKEGRGGGGGGVGSLECRSFGFSRGVPLQSCNTGTPILEVALVCESKTRLVPLHHQKQKVQEGDITFDTPVSPYLASAAAYRRGDGAVDEC